MEIDIDANEQAIIFGDKQAKMKIDNAPLRSCYQRPSDCPLMNTDGALGYTISSTRRRRSLDDRDDDIMSVVEFKEKHMRSKRQTFTYNYNAFCDRVLDGSSSTLAQ